VTIHQSRRARGFSLVELLVVIGVILVLVGIAAYAFSRLDPTEKSTRATLGNAKAMLGELEASAGFGEIKRIHDLDNNDEDRDEILRAIFRIPSNKEALSKLGPRAVKAGDPPKLLDGWGNEIRYYNEKATVNLGYDVQNDRYAQQNIEIRSPDGRPFFASPGPDGKMENGDDNIYSFEF
jgi:prepilin-type N-terminal cleavage/methylation domain-containing protein